VFIKIFLRS